MPVDVVKGISFKASCLNGGTHNASICASRHASCVPSWIALYSFVQQQSAYIYIHFIDNGMTAA